jgi:hypothetical protein
MKRPKLITIICVTGYLSVLFSFPQVFSPTVKKLGVLMPALYGVLVAAHFISCVGLWYFKQWGAQLYLLAFFAKTLFFLLTAQTGVLFYLNATVSIVFMVILVKYFPKMNTNL